MKKLNKKQKLLIEEMKKDPQVSHRDLGYIFNVNSRTIERRVQKLREMGVMKRIGPNHRGKVRGRWIVLK